MAERKGSAHVHCTVPVLFVLVHLVAALVVLRGGVRSLARHFLRQVYDGSLNGAGGGAAAIEEWGLAVAPLLLFALAWLLTDFSPQTRRERVGNEPDTSWSGCRYRECTDGR